jgi:hypothetical protein
MPGFSCSFEFEQHVKRDFAMKPGCGDKAWDVAPKRECNEDGFLALLGLFLGFYAYIVKLLLPTGEVIGDPEP